MISNALFYNIKNFDYKNEKKMYKVMIFEGENVLTGSQSN